MHTSSWPAFAGGFGPAVPIPSLSVVSSPFRGATILTFFAGGFDTDYDESVAVNFSTRSHPVCAYLRRIFGILYFFGSRNRLDRPISRLGSHEILLLIWRFLLE